MYKQNKFTRIFLAILLLITGGITFYVVQNLQEDQSAEDSDASTEINSCGINNVVGVGGASQDMFLCNGKEFSFVGVNIRELAYMDKRTMPNGRNDDLEFEIREQLLFANEMGANVVRFYAPYKDVTNEEAISRIKKVLEISNEVSPEMKFIITLTDFNKSDNFVNGDNAFYQNGFLKREWFETGYTQNYLPFVEAVASDTGLKSSKQIMAWQLINEAQVSTNGGNMENVLLDFLYTVGLKLNNPASLGGLEVGQMITPGFKHINHSVSETLNTTQISTLLNNIYKTRTVGISTQISPFDFASFNIYNGDFARTDINTEVAWYVENNFPYIIGEIGFSNNFIGASWNNEQITLGSNQDRSPAFYKTISKYFSEFGADGVLQWGFNAGNMSMATDSTLGMDQFNYKDWFDRSESSITFGKLFPLYKCISRELENSNKNFIVCNPETVTNTLSLPVFIKPLDGQTYTDTDFIKFEWNNVKSQSENITYKIYTWNGELAPQSNLDPESFITQTVTNETFVEFPITYFKQDTNYSAVVFAEEVSSNEIIHSPTVFNFKVNGEVTNATICGPIDVNSDNKINLIDFSQFARKYQSSCNDTETYTGCGGMDTNSDRKIDIVDFSSLAREYNKDSCIE